MPITSQTGLREYHGDLSQFTGNTAGLSADIHTLKSFSPFTTNRVRVVMTRAPKFMESYCRVNNNKYDSHSLLAVYKAAIEYWCTDITLTFGEATLNSATYQGGFAGRSIIIPTTQAPASQQQIVFNVPELEGSPISTYHNAYVEGISDSMTGLTTFNGYVGIRSNNSTDGLIRAYKPFSNSGDTSDEAYEANMANMVSEFLIMVLDRTGLQAEAAAMAIGCIPYAKVGRNEKFKHSGNGQSQLLPLQLTYNCQLVESVYVNDLAARYLRDHPIVGHSYNYNPGAGDAFFQSANSTSIDGEMFQNQPRNNAIQSGLGNVPVFTSNYSAETKQTMDQHTLTPADHSQIYLSPTETASITESDN